MKNLFIISEEEKKRILGLHESATKRQYLSEQVQYYKGADGKVGVINGPYDLSQKVPGATKISREEYEKAIGVNQTKTSPQTSQFKMSAGEKEYREKLAKGEIDRQGNKIKKTGEANPGTTQVKQRTIPKSIEQLSQKGYYLRKGDKGPLVKIIQNKLLDAGEEVSATSVFDDMTKQGVINVQTKNGLKADGIIGPKTWDILSKTQTQKMTTKDTEPLKSIAPSNVPADYGKTNQGVANPNQTPIRGTGRGSGLGNMELNQP